MLPIFFLITAALLLSSTSGNPASDPWRVNEDDHDYTAVTPHHEMPRILTQNKSIEEVIGSSVLLPCDVVKLGKYSVVWQRGNKIIWVLQGEPPNSDIVDVIPHERMEKKGTSIIVHDVAPEDAGEYSCEVRSAGQLVVHKLVVLEPPRVKMQNGYFLSRAEGDSAELSCKATAGTPQPTIYWEKDDEIIQRDHSPTLFIESVKLSDEGIYACVAENGVGDAAKAEISLKVNYSPKVGAPESIIYSGVGYNVDLYCTVEASPEELQVQWFKDDDLSAPLDLKNGIEKNNTYYVSIQPVHSGVFGIYICHASNFWGNDSATIELTGRPGRPVIKNVRKGEKAGQYILTWEVESFSSIAGYDVFYKEGLDEGDVWANVTVPGRHSNSMYINQQYTLEDITPDVSLLVKIKARNEFGDSEWSDISSFVATTSGSHEKIKLVTRATSKMDPNDKFFHIDVDGEEDEDGLSDSFSDENANVSILNMEETTNGSSGGFPQLTPAQKKAQMVALITAISLSSFFY